MSGKLQHKTLFLKENFWVNYEADIKQGMRAKASTLNLVFANRNEKRSFPSKERVVRVISVQILEEKINGVNKMRVSENRLQMAKS